MATTCLRPQSQAYGQSRRAQINMSSSPADNNAAGGNNNERARLTEREKKQNHIVSEQKRRQAIRAGFDRLAAMVPGMTGQGRSEAVVLESAVKYDHLCARRKRKLEKLLVNKAVTRVEFDAAYTLDTTGRAEHEAVLKGDTTN